MGVYRLEDVDNLGKLKMWVLEEVERKAIEKDKKEIKKKCEKLWNKWEKQGFISSKSGANLPSQNIMMCIGTAAAAAFREAKMDWEKGAQQRWGAAYSKMQKCKNIQELTLAMCAEMNAAGKLKDEKKKEEMKVEEEEIEPAGLIPAVDFASPQSHRFKNKMESSPLEGELFGQFSGTITRPVQQSTPSSTIQSSQQQPSQRTHTMKLRSTTKQDQLVNSEI